MSGGKRSLLVLQPEREPAERRGPLRARGNGGDGGRVARLAALQRERRARRDGDRLPRGRRIERRIDGAAEEPPRGAALHDLGDLRFEQHVPIGYQRRARGDLHIAVGAAERPLGQEAELDSDRLTGARDLARDHTALERGRTPIAQRNRQSHGAAAHPAAVIGLRPLPKQALRDCPGLRPQLLIRLHSGRPRRRAAQNCVGQEGKPDQVRAALIAARQRQHLHGNLSRRRRRALRLLGAGLEFLLFRLGRRRWGVYLARLDRDGVNARVALVGGNDQDPVPTRGKGPANVVADSIACDQLARFRVEDDLRPDVGG